MKRTHPHGMNGNTVAWRVDLRRIDRERILRGWTRSELARRAKVDPGTVSDLFMARRRPLLGTVQALVVPLGLTVADVIEFPHERPPERMAS
jgi:transcriptional regulator with XRE-family HTH domain